MRVRFNDLPKRLRERLVELSHNPKDPAVVAADTGMSGGWFKYLTLVGGLGGAAYALDFLVRRHAHHIHPHHDIEVFWGLAAAAFVAFCSLAAIALARVFPPPPYREGQWALTSHLMKLTPGWVVLFPLDRQGKPTIVTVLRNGAYSGSRLQLDGGFTFYFRSKADVDQACARILAAREAYTQALNAKDTRALAQLDIFSEHTLSGSWKAAGTLEENDGPRSNETPNAAVIGQWLGSLVAGAAVAMVAYRIFIALHGSGG
ncbi:MAG: hypothetical protein JNK82_32845 [Myxococcaceae bacterium]|nr:hypothetical protein [Myxococcaceae bacterium]